MHTYVQQKDITKLLGLNYRIIYNKKTWREKKKLIVVITRILSAWMMEVQDSYVADIEV